MLFSPQEYAEFFHNISTKKAFHHNDRSDTITVFNYIIPA